MNMRRFNENDYPTILDIYAQSKLDELRYENKKFELLPLENDSKRLPELRESDIYVYEDGGIIDYGALYGSEIRALFVYPNRRGNGIGKCFLKFLLSKIEGTASLYVAKTNVPAKNLYEKFGFKVIEEFETSYNGIPVFANKMIFTGENG